MITLPHCEPPSISLSPPNVPDSASQAMGLQKQGRGEIVPKPPQEKHVWGRSEAAEVPHVPRRIALMEGTSWMSHTPIRVAALCGFPGLSKARGHSGTGLSPIQLQAGNGL